MNTVSNSIGISKWAKGFEINKVWSSGYGDNLIVGWERSDGFRAIETNGDPIFEGEFGFEEFWNLNEFNISV